MNDTPISEMTFEQAMSELERIVTELERGDVPLEDSISLYEKGAELKKRCETKLKEAEQKVAAITLDEDGSCLLYTSPSPRDKRQSRMPSSA